MIYTILHHFIHRFWCPWGSWNQSRTIPRNDYLLTVSSAQGPSRLRPGKEEKVGSVADDSQLGGVSELGHRILMVSLWQKIQIPF